MNGEAILVELRFGWTYCDYPLGDNCFGWNELNVQNCYETVLWLPSLDKNSTTRRIGGEVIAPHVGLKERDEKTRTSQRMKVKRLIQISSIVPCAFMLSELNSHLVLIAISVSTVCPLMAKGNMDFMMNANMFTHASITS